MKKETNKQSKTTHIILLLWLTGLVLKLYGYLNLLSFIFIPEINYCLLTLLLSEFALIISILCFLIFTLSGIYKVRDKENE